MINPMYSSTLSDSSRLGLYNTPSSSLQCPGYDIKPSDGWTPTLDIWGMGSTHSLPLLLDPL